jgi:hypothetical protein
VSIEERFCESLLNVSLLDLSLGCKINISDELDEISSSFSHLGKFRPLGVASIEMLAFEISPLDTNSPPSTIDTDADTY